MDREPVTSSSVKSRGYDPETKTMEVEFNSGSVYRYNDVPQEKWDEWQTAPSPGGHFAQEFRNGYGFEKVE